MKMIKILTQSIYYQLLISLRVKKSVFFTIVFPILLFIIFGNIWGTGQKEYITLMLSGIIGMTISSDGLYAIGPVIKHYYSSGLIKYLRKLPFNILLHFSGLIISRIIILLFTVASLCLVAKLMFGYTVSLVEVINYILGVLIGMFIFSFLGLVVSFSGIKKDAINDLGINFIYFTILFTSNAFYPVGNFSKTIHFIGNILPLNPVLSILRSNGFNVFIMFWLLFPALIFYFLFNKIKLSRT